MSIWSHGFVSDDGHARYVAVNGMNSLAKDLAVGLDVRCSTMAFAIRPADTGDDAPPWQVVIDDASTVDSDAVIVTTPLPQAFSLLVDSGIELDEAMIRTDYDRTIALLATLDGAPAIPAPGGVQRPNPDVAFVADNHAKGVSAAPAITAARIGELERGALGRRPRRPAGAPARVVQQLDRRREHRRGPGEEVAFRHAAVAVAGPVLGGSRWHDRVGR